VGLIGRSPDYAFDRDHPERSWWVGKPWRRVEVYRRDAFYKGERIDRSWDVAIHLGCRRLGVGLELRAFRAVGMDYSEEPHQ